MSRKKAIRSKRPLEEPLRRSEFDDELLRDNVRTNNRLKTQIQRHDRTYQKILRAIGKESQLLQDKLENDKKALSLGLFGHKLGLISPRGHRKYSPTSPTRKNLLSDSVKPVAQKLSSDKPDRKFPWDSDATDIESTAERDSVLSNRTSVNKSKGSARLKALLERYPSSRAQSDNFLATLLNDAKNDEIMYTKSPSMMSANLVSQESSKPSRRRKTRTPLQRSSSTSNSIVNVLNVRETEPLYQ